jgi:hypothetical protein
MKEKYIEKILKKIEEDIEIINQHRSAINSELTYIWTAQSILTMN